MSTTPATVRPAGGAECVDDVVERMTATVVAGGAADDQRQIPQVIAEAQELVEPLDVDHRGDRPPVPLDHDLAPGGRRRRRAGRCPAGSLR